MFLTKSSSRITILTSLLIGIFLTMGWLLFLRPIPTQAMRAPNDSAACYVEINGDEHTDYSSMDASAVQTATVMASPNALIKIAGVCAGVQNVNGISQTVYITQNLTLQGGYTETNWLAEPEPNLYPTILDAQNHGRVIYLTRSRNVTLSHLIIQNGQVVGNGGGIYDSGSFGPFSHLIVINTLIRNNRAEPGRGGGIYGAAGAGLEVIDSTFHENVSTGSYGYGGGIFNTANAIITRSYFTNNQAQHGGGAYLQDGQITNGVFQENAAGIGGGLKVEITGDVTITNSVFFINHVTSWGGAIYIREYANVHMVDSIIAGNTASTGGGIFNGGNLDIVGSTIRTNTSTWSGGGILNNGGDYGNGVLTLVNSTVRDNWGRNGGGIVNDYQATIIFSTIVENFASEQGSAIYNGSNNLMNISNSVVAYSAFGSNDCANFGTINDQGYNLSEDGTCVSPAGGDPLLAPLAENGGFTPTHLPLPYSPLIDRIPAGINGCGTEFITDQRGGPRLVDGACDIGSVELNINYPPLIAIPDSYTVTANVPLVVAPLGVLSNDIDGDNGPLTATLQTGVMSGTLVLNADGSFEYNPGGDYDYLNPDQSVIETFAYIASDGVLSDTAIVTITVQGVNDNPMVDAGFDQIAEEGQSVEFQGEYSDPGLLSPAMAGESILWDFGDGSILTGTLTPVHTYLDNGIYTVTLTITDPLGGSGVDWLYVDVKNVSPTLGIFPSQEITTGLPIAIAGTVTDPGLLDTQTIVIIWADGVTDTLHLAAGEGQFTAIHTYTQEGEYIVTVRVTDKDGGQDEKEFTVVVKDAPILTNDYAIYLPLVVR